MGACTSRQINEEVSIRELSADLELDGPSGPASMISLDSDALDASRRSVSDTAVHDSSDTGAQPVQGSPQRTKWISATMWDTESLAMASQSPVRRAAAIGRLGAFAQSYERTQHLRQARYLPSDSRGSKRDCSLNSQSTGNARCRSVSDLTPRTWVPSDYGPSRPKLPTPSQPTARADQTRPCSFTEDGLSTMTDTMSLATDEESWFGAGVGYDHAPPHVELDRSETSLSAFDRSMGEAVPHSRFNWFG